MVGTYFVKVWRKRNLLELPILTQTLSSQVRGREQPDDTDLRLRLKYGKHTIFLFVDPLAPFSDITTELVQVLRERYPDGLSASRASPSATPLPADGEEFHVAYAILKTPSDPSQGWKNLNITGTEKPIDLKIKQNTVLAFAFQDELEATAPFNVEWPSYDELEFD